MTRIKLILVGILLVFGLCKCEVTMEDMNKAANLMKQACLPKFKIPDDMMKDLQQNIFADNRDLKCFINCMLEMMQIMKKGKVNYQSAMKQVESLVPEDMKPDYKKGIEACKDAANGIKDHCESSFAVIKCYVANNPKFAIP